MPRMTVRNRRSRTSCSILALATVMTVGATPAAAQSFLGTGNFAANGGGAANIDQSVASLTTVTLNGGQSIIDWSPNDTAISSDPIAFQLSGTTATFTSANDFAVLNRINPNDLSRAISMNGTVNSLVDGVAGRGSVYFYAQGGFILGPSAAFNVGSLVFSALPIQVNDGSFITGPGNTVVFNQAPNPGATISTNATTQMSAMAGGSYVAMVAPRVVHNGTITVNGSAALVAAEAATINFSPDGLFDIQVDTGTTNANGIVVNGNITGPTPSVDNRQGVYLVAVPKNDALTMVIGNGADLGFTLANNAAVDDNGVVVLSAGHDIVDGAIGARSAGHGASATGNLAVTGAHVTSNLVGEATGTAQLFSNVGQPTTIFDSDVTVHSIGALSMSAQGAGTTLTVGGDLNLSTDRTGSAGQSVTAANLTMSANTGGTLSVTGSTTLNANATAASVAGGTAGNATGGFASVNAENGTMNLAALTINAQGNGGGGIESGANAGDGTGGTIWLHSDTNGSMTITGPVALNTLGTGGSADGAGTAGDGRGGSAFIYVGTNGALTIDGETTVDSDGYGGGHNSGAAGSGTGGIAQLSWTTGSTTGGLLTFNNSLALGADGVGGNSDTGTGGFGLGGSAGLYSSTHRYVVNADFYAHALGQGGHSETGTGGAGQGGGAGIGSTGSEVDITGWVTIDSSGDGGDGDIGGSGTGGTSQISSTHDVALGEQVFVYSTGYGEDSWEANGALGDGGNIYILAEGGGLLSMGNLYAQANGEGGGADSGFTSGNGLGGTVHLRAAADSTLTITGGASAYAEGIGGETYSTGTNGGDGTGGNIQVTATGNNAALSIGSYTYLNANGRAGYAGECTVCGGLGGQGFGGDIFVSVSGTNATMGLGNLDAYARGYGGLGVDANGGYGEGGSISINASNDGSLTIANNVYAEATGRGGNHVEYEGDDGPGRGGHGVGGSVEMRTHGTGAPEILIGGSAQLKAQGEGGDANYDIEDGDGGNGTGGFALIEANAGLIDVDGGGYGGGYVDASGFGGDASEGIGGDGFGHHAAIAVNGGDVDIGGWFDVEADGYGGNGLTGGDGVGGGNYLTGEFGAHLFAKRGSITLGSGSVTADGYGGDAGYYYGGDGNGGGSGGNGTGGWATVTARNSDLGPSSISIAGAEPSLTVSASGYGGYGDNGVNGENGIRGSDGSDADGAGEGGNATDGTAGTAGGAGGAGGSGTGGRVVVTAAAGSGELDIPWLQARAIGEGGQGGEGGYGGNGGYGGDGGDGSGVDNSGGDGGNGGDGGTGGTGGAGGAAIGGHVTVGTESASHEAIGDNLGLATFDSVEVDTSAYGGRGGNGGANGYAGLGGAAGSGDPSGTAGTDGNNGAGGNGGDGGDANGGTALLLVRGSTVDAGTIDLTANAIGGDGGIGYSYSYGGITPGVDGIGGDAESDEALVIASSRYLLPEQRGTLLADSITATVEAVGGSGSVFGASVMEGGSAFQFEGGADATIGSVNFSIVADQQLPDLAHDQVTIIGGDVTVLDTFAFDTDGVLSFYIDDGSLTASTLNLTAWNFITHPDLDPPADRGTAFADTVNVTSSGDFIADADFDVTNTFFVDVPGSIRVGHVQDDNGVDFNAQGGWIDTGSITAGDYVELSAWDSIYTWDISAGSYVDIWSDVGSINVGSIDAGNSVNLRAGSSINGANIDAGGTIWADAVGGGINLAQLTSTSGSINLTAEGDIFVSGDMLADGDIEVLANGDIWIQNATAGESIDIDAGGYMDVGGGYVDALNLTAGDEVEVEAREWASLGNLSAGLVNPSTNEDADYTVSVLAGEEITTGNIAAASHIGLATPSTMTTGDIDAGGIFMALGTGNMDFGDATAGEEIYLADFSMMALGGGENITDEFDPQPVLAAEPVATGGFIDIGDVEASRFTAAAGTNLTTGIIDSNTSIELSAGEAISTGNLFAGNFVLANGGSIETGGIEADSVEMTSTGGDIIVNGDIEAFGPVELDAFANIDTGHITAESIDLLAGNDIDTGDLTTIIVAQQLAEVPGPAFLYPGASITLEADGDIGTGDIDSYDGVYASAGENLITGSIDAETFVELHSVGFTDTDYIDAGSYVFVDAGGYIDSGDLDAGSDIELLSGSSILFGNADAGIRFDFEAEGSVNGGNVVAGLSIEGETAGPVTLLNLTAGLNPGQASDDDTFSVGIQAAGAISVGNVQGAERVGFASLGNVTTGSLQSGWDVFLFSDGAISTGAITSGAGDHVFMSGTDAFFAAGGGEDSDFDPAAALAGDPSPTGGTIFIDGPVQTGTFRAAAGTNLIAQAITATTIDASAGGTAGIHGIWAAQNITLESSDINITATGRVDASQNVTLLSSNTTQALIGDGLTGTGYALSNAEFGRISGNQVRIVGRGDASAAIDMLIGDLSVTGPLVGSTVEGSDGILVFAVGNIQSQTPAGVIRVAGDVNATGFGGGNAIEFYADRFELDAANGSIGITSSGSTLGGELGLYADRIHVASAAILDQLAVNPTYAGYQEDLNEAAAVQRPEGVLRADTLWIESDNLQSILIQNTGTAGTDGTPAGFLVREAFVNDDDEVAGPPGSINLVVNGQLVTEGGTLTGVEVRDALVEGENITPFTANSTINGCLLAGPCGIEEPVLPPPPPPTNDDQIDLINWDPLGDSDFGNEPDIDDNEEGDEGADNPITPPQPLFDSRPLIPASDVNDPVSGTGNPSLLGGEATCEPAEDGQGCPVEPVEGDE